MEKVATVGLDLAKSIFQIHAVNDSGDVLVRRALRRSQVLDFFHKLPVCRIFQEFSGGKSPRAIAHALNADRLPGPSGRPWSDTAIRGHALRRTGILRNEAYVGKLIWNKQRYIKDPNTGKRLARVNPTSEWIVRDTPDLRLVDDGLWDRVQARLAGIRDSAGIKKALSTKFWLNRRAKHLLTGLVYCKSCGGPLSAGGRDYLCCSTARRLGTCTNRKGIRRSILEAFILDALKDNLMHPDLVAEFIKEFHAEVNRRRRDAELSLGLKRRELDDIRRKLDGLIEAIADGFRAPGLQAKLDELENRKRLLEADIEAAPAPAPRLHPKLSEIYRQKVAGLQTALDDPATRTEALEILRGLIERVDVDMAKDGLTIELTGEIANMVRLSGGSESLAREPYRSSVKVVAGTCNHRQYLICAPI